jgi:hypothetical protein
MMKKLAIKTSILMVSILFMVTACEDNAIIFDSSLNLVGFTTSGLTIIENQNAASPFQIYFGAEEGTPPTTVTLSVDTVGLGAAAAKEGEDFTISTKSVSVEVGEATVNITPVDNSIFTGNKKFYLVITSATASRISAQKRLLVTIADDEHPLKKWIGTYTVTAVSYGNPGGWDEEWSVATAAVDGHLDQLAITGLGFGSTEPMIATVDKDALTISIVSGQTLGAAYGSDNGEVKLYYGTNTIIGQVLAGEGITSEMLIEAAAINITGTIGTDGTIYLDKMGMVLTDYDWCWDVFDTTWEKQ